MGASQSRQTRTVSMENNSSAGLIEVSDDVVERLKNGMSKAESNKRAEQVLETKQNVPSSFPSPKSYPPGVIYGEPTITAMEVRRQKEIELEKNDQYWKKRLAYLEQTLNKTNTIMEREYSAAVEDVRRRFQSAPPTHQLPPCQDLKAQLIACYRAHPGEPLKCSDEATAFINCVSENRVKKLDEPPAAPPTRSG